MRKKIIIGIGIVVIVLGSGLLLVGIRYSPVLFQLVFNRGVELHHQSERINILALGIGGGSHEGPNLSDTIIFASIDLEKKRVILVSIPRDLWIGDLEAKINTAYAFGEEKQKGGGLVLAKAAVSKIVGQPVDYVIRIDFDGFVKAVDLVGGLAINIERAFDDYEYPIEGKENDPCGHSDEELKQLATASSQLGAFPCRYTHIHFNQGITQMNGKRVLEYVRSRHAEGVEGTDFARSRRQERVISSFREKVFSFSTLLNPVKVLSLYSTLQENIATDIKESEFDDFIRLTRDMKDAKIESLVLDVGDDEGKRQGLLMNPPISQEYHLQWVLIPKAGNNNFKEIQQYIDCALKDSCQQSAEKKIQ